MERIRLAVIGTGFAWERLHWPALQELSAQYEVIALCDRIREKAATWAERLGLTEDRVYDDYHQMLKRSDIDAVDILVPIELNYEVAHHVAETGKAIILEKPLAPTRDQAKESVDLPLKYKVPVMVAENFRYSEEYNSLRDLVRQKRIGEPIYVIHHNASCFPCSMTKDTFAATEWRQHPDYPGGDFLDAALHDLAGLRHVFGAIDRLHAFGHPQKDDYSPYLSYHVNIGFMNGVIGQYTFFTGGKELQRPLVGLRIVGTQGQIYLEDKSCGVINLFLPGTHEMIPFKPGRGYYNELMNFYKAFHHQEPIAVPPEMEYGDAHTVFAVLDSLRDGGVVEVDRTAVYEPAY
ncbi:MAG TPA: Gfo/Idh/MocA family oxidoreductase [Bacillota bacterium]|nr:Gfo/Idh/MocA family oxidoreductase [Bacillota bacterium]